jgi:catechol 2,3-dioxygenase-like lactoylglutathione lyase family enzyme
MRATSFTHVSIHANDLEESLRFYVDVFGMRRIPSPDFEHPVEWLELGGQQLHLFLRDTPAPEFHHIGIDVDDFEAAYRIASERGLFDRDAWSPNVRVLMDGAVQMYLRDPAGNLVEVNWPDVNTLDRSVVTEVTLITDERPQSAEAQRATLYPARSPVA